MGELFKTIVRNREATGKRKFVRNRLVGYDFTPPGIIWWGIVEKATAGTKTLYFSAKRTANCTNVIIQTKDVKTYVYPWNDEDTMKTLTDIVFENPIRPYYLDEFLLFSSKNPNNWEDKTIELKINVDNVISADFCIMHEGVQFGNETKIGKVIWNNCNWKNLDVFKFHMTAWGFKEFEHKNWQVYNTPLLEILPACWVYNFTRNSTAEQFIDIDTNDIVWGGAPKKPKLFALRFCPTMQYDYYLGNTTRINLTLSKLYTDYCNDVSQLGWNGAGDLHQGFCPLNHVYIEKPFRNPLIVADGVYKGFEGCPFMNNYYVERIGQEEYYIPDTKENLGFFETDKEGIPVGIIWWGYKSAYGAFELYFSHAETPNCPTKYVQTASTAWADPPWMVKKNVGNYDPLECRYWTFESRIRPLSLRGIFQRRPDRGNPTPFTDVYVNIETDKVINPCTMCGTFVYYTGPVAGMFEKFIMNDCDFTNLDPSLINVNYGHFQVGDNIGRERRLRNWKFKKAYIDKYQTVQQQGSTYRAAYLFNDIMYDTSGHFGAPAGSSSYLLLDMTNGRCVDGRPEVAGITSVHLETNATYDRNMFANHLTAILPQFVTQAKKIKSSMGSMQKGYAEFSPCDHAYVQVPFPNDVTWSLTSTSFTGNINMHNYDAQRVKQAKYYVVDDGTNYGLFEMIPPEYLPA